jgi:hypothetical protein
LLHILKQLKELRVDFLLLQLLLLLLVLHTRQLITQERYRLQDAVSFSDVMHLPVLRPFHLNLPLRYKLLELAPQLKEINLQLFVGSQ